MLPRIGLLGRSARLCVAGLICSVRLGLAGEITPTLWLGGGQRYVDGAADQVQSTTTGSYLTSLDGEVGLKQTGSRGGTWGFQYHPSLSVYTQDMRQRGISHVLSANGTWLPSPRVSIQAWDSFLKLYQQIGLVDPAAPDNPGLLLRTSRRSSNTFNLEGKIQATERSAIRMGGRSVVTSLSSESLTGTSETVGTLGYDFNISEGSLLQAGYEFHHFDFTGVDSSHAQIADLRWTRQSPLESQGWGVGTGAARVEQGGVTATEPVVNLDFYLAPPTSHLRWSAGAARTVSTTPGVAGPVVDVKGLTSLLAHISPRLTAASDVSYGRKSPVFGGVPLDLRYRRIGFHLDYHWTDRLSSLVDFYRQEQRSPDYLFPVKRVDYYHLGIRYRFLPREQKGNSTE